MAEPGQKEVKILETVDDIQGRRNEVLGRYSDFKKKTEERKKELEEAKKYQLFKRDADELENWILEKIQAISDDSYTDYNSLQSKIQKHQAIEAEVTAHSNTLQNLDATGKTMIDDGHAKSDEVGKRLEELHDLWDKLMKLLQEKGRKLQQALEYFQFLREADNVLNWIKLKQEYVESNDFDAVDEKDMDVVEQQQKMFDEFMLDLQHQEQRVEEVGNAADKLIREEHPEEQRITNKKDELVEAMRRLKEKASRKQQRLFEKYEVTKYYRDAMETENWINEKDASLSSDDTGRDLPSIQALQRKHDGLERDLDALQKKVGKLVEAADQLSDKYTDHADDLRRTRDQLSDKWEALKSKAAKRKARLDDAYNLHRFLTDSRELASWLGAMKSVVAADSLANDVAGAEALLERIFEHKNEVDARNEAYENTLQQGRALLDGDHAAKDEVAERMELLTKEKKEVDDLIETKELEYKQCMDLQLFYRDSDQLESWINKQEAFLDNKDVGDSMDTVEALISKQEDFEKSLAAQQQKITLVDEHANNLISSKHYAVDDISKRNKDLQVKWEHLLEKAKKRKAALDESRNYQTFDRDADEMKSWIAEKLKHATDENYKDPSNLQSKLQKHQNFKAEVIANDKRLQALKKFGEELLANEHANADNIGERIAELDEMWNRLLAEMENKNTKLEQANDQLQFTRNIEDFEMWLTETEGQLMSEDTGLNLDAVANLQKKHNLLEADIAAHQDRVQYFAKKADEFEDSGHFDADKIRARQREVDQRYAAMQEPLQKRKERISRMRRTGLGRRRLWLPALIGYFANANEAEIWMKEKEPLVSSIDFGKDEDSTEALIKKHESLIEDVKAYGAQIEQLREQADGCKLREAPVADTFAREKVVVIHDYDGYKAPVPNPMPIIVRKNEILTLISTNHSQFWKVEKNDGQGYVPVQCVKKIDAPLSDSQAHLIEQNTVASRQKQIEEQYERLLKVGKDRSERLNQSNNAYKLVREANDLSQWIVETETKIIEEEQEEVFDKVEEQQKRFNEMLKSKEDKKKKIEDLKAVADQLTLLGQTEAVEKITTQVENLSQRWTALDSMTQEKANQLEKCHAVQLFHRDLDETAEWINEKEMAVSIDDVGKDLPSVQRLRRKHGALERDLNALDERIRDLDAKASQLTKEHPEEMNAITDHLDEVLGKWRDLTSRADMRKTKLEASEELQRFMADYRDLKSWIDTMMALVSSDELAHDITSAEALLERHSEHKVEIEARKGTFNNFENYGNSLLDRGHYASDEIKERMEELAKLQKQLGTSWEERSKILGENLDLQYYLRECEQLEEWMTIREGSIKQADSAVDGDKTVDVLMKKHEDLDRAIKIQEDKIKTMVAQADSLRNSEHYDSDGIENKKQEVLARWGSLKKAMEADRAKLGDVRNLQDFIRDAEEMNIWINEKLQSVGDDSYKDSAKIANVQAKYQKHQAFVAELAANADRLRGVVENGQKLIDNGQCMGQEDAVKEQVENLQNGWKELNKRAEDKSEKLNEANRQAVYNAGIKDIEFWLEETEHALDNQQTGRDSGAVDDLFNKQEILRADIATHQERIADLDRFAQDPTGQLDPEAVQERKNLINDRYEKIKKLCDERAARLEKAKKLHDFFRNLDDEEAWIREKKILVQSGELGRDLLGVQNLMKKHRRLEGDIHAHEPAIRAVEEEGHRLIAEGKVEEEEAWIMEKQHLLSSNDLGDNLAAVQGLLKKHDTFETDCHVHEERCQEICSKGDELIAADNIQKDTIERRCEGLKAKLEVLRNAAAKRRSQLTDNSAFLQFMWKTDVVESWIKDKESIVRSDDYGRDLSSVQTLLTKQEAFDAGLQAFEKEGIQSISALRDQLVEAKHDQTEAINNRLKFVLQRWEALKKGSTARRDQLKDLEKRYKHVEDLFLQFAKEASAFNSWYENAEEDLLDPVQCNSLDEVKKLREHHERFKVSLKDSEERYRSLEKLDKEIKEFAVTLNPYTWYTMENIQSTWENLKAIIVNRDRELTAELRNQERKEEFRKSFANIANKFHDWVETTRRAMLSISTQEDLNYEAQLQRIKEASVDIRARKQDLKDINQWTTSLENEMILENQYTSHSAVSLSQAWDQLDQLAMRMQHSLEQTILALQQAGVPDDVKREYIMMFKHFDKDNSGRLDKREFKQCLLALGHDLKFGEDSDAVFDSVMARVDPNRSGYVEMQEFINYMIMKETENVSSRLDVEEAFKALCREGRPYITRDELYSSLPKVQADYCVRSMEPYVDPNGRAVPDAYNYQKFTMNVFQN
uniref:Spectrin alpha chain n=1 Tax=Macrostomum lignano TaxID=282301 RepID=A0A1I8HD84_9PLAT